MLTVNDLEELETYMRSGELEADFKDGCENDRFYLLELLEKLMDVAELADATATRLIFRGLTVPRRVSCGNGPNFMRNARPGAEPSPQPRRAGRHPQSGSHRAA